ncbi:MAG: hypothetical protein ACK5HR_03730 [Mycoplasmatales bacterium]
MYTTENKDKLIEILKHDVKLNTKEIVIFLGITESTYTKMVSSVNRDLPKKSQVLLEHFYNTSSWEKLLKRVKENPQKARTLVKMSQFRKNFDPDIYIKNFEIIIAFMKSKKLQQLTEEDFNVLIEMFNSDKLYEGIKQKIRLYKFFTTGDDSELQPKDIKNIGSHSVMNKKNNQKILDELQKQGEEVVKRVKIKYEDNSII